MDVLYGLHPVEEAIRAGVRQIDPVSVAREREAVEAQRWEEANRESRRVAQVLKALVAQVEDATRLLKQVGD